MSKIKYYYNTKTLRYERYVEGWGKKVLRALYVVAATAVFSAVVLFFAYRYLESPKEKRYERELANLELNYQLLVERMIQAEAVLKDLEERDDNIYRVIFEAEPIPDEIRNAGFGGVNRYQRYEGFEYSDLIIEVTQHLDKLTKQVVIQSKSYDEIWDMVKNQDVMLASIPAIMPIQHKDLKYMASGFGERIDPVYKTVKFHAGMDFVADVGKPVFATGDGTIVRADNESRGYGNHVRIDHGFGYLTLYAHLSEIKVKPGQIIKRGTLIGLVGNTGKSVGPHLHYEVHKNGRPVNPISYYFSDLDPIQYQQLLDVTSQPSQTFD